MKQNSNLKKEGLLLIIDRYLCLSTPQSLLFLSKHIPSTKDLALSLGSHTENGLTINQLHLNHQFYGRNSIEADDKSLCQRFCKTLTEEIFRMRTGLIMFVILFEIICAHVWKVYEMKLTSISVLIALGISWVVKIGLSLREQTILEERSNIKEPNTVYVYRSGSKFAVSADDLTVGDLVFVDYHQTAPATGILISKDELELDENKYNRGLQSKLPLEDCLELLTEKNQLQLRMDVQSGALASPIILRGTLNTTGRTFKMLVLAVNQRPILSKHLSGTDRENAVSAIELWIDKVTIFSQKVVSIFLVVAVLFHILAFISKIRGLPSGQFIPFATTIVQNSQAIVCLVLLTDSSLLRGLLRGSYLQVVGMLGARQNIDRFLSVEQLFLTEESICKYDNLDIQKVVLADFNDPMDIDLVPEVKPKQSYLLLYEVLAGVGLQKGLGVPKQPKVHKNSIIHVIGLQQRVFSSLYSEYREPKSPDTIIQDGQTLSEIMRSNGQLLRKHYNNTNRVQPNEVVGKERTESIQYNFDIQFQRSQDPPSLQGQTAAIKLDEFLSKHCNCSTQNIVEGLNKLAKNISRTYFFQRFTQQKLSQIRTVWSGGLFVPSTEKIRDSLQVGIKKLEKEGLTPYLVGFDEGAFSKKYMTFLLGVVGVEVKVEKEVKNKIEQLEQIGVHIIFTIQEHDEELLSQRQKAMIQKQFRDRKWALPDHNFVDMESIQAKGGRLLCSDCLTSKCKCRCRREELANPQGFLEAVSNIRCVYGVSQKDLTYLQRGFQQMCMTTLSLTDHYQDIPRKIDQIIAGNELFCALEENLTLWITWLAANIFCFFPFNFLTFNHIFSHPQLYISLVIFQILIIKHQFSGSASLIASKNLNLSKRNRQMMGLALKIDIVVFIICLAASGFMVLNYPTWFSGPVPRQGLVGYSCQLVPSFYHNPSIIKSLCSLGSQSVLLFSKTGTFIFLYVQLAFILRSAITVHQPISKSNIAFHFILISCLVLLVQFCPETFQVAREGLSLKGYGICVGWAVGTVAVGWLSRVIVSLVGSGKIFHVQIHIGERVNEYTELLKEFKQQKTLDFPLEKEECQM